MVLTWLIFDMLWRKICQQKWFLSYDGLTLNKWLLQEPWICSVCKMKSTLWLLLLFCRQAPKRLQASVDIDQLYIWVIWLAWLNRWQSHTAMSFFCCHLFLVTSVRLPCLAAHFSQEPHIFETKVSQGCCDMADTGCLLNVKAHWGWGKILQTTFSNAFSSMKMCDFRLKFHWSLRLRVKLIINYHWFR